MLRAVFPTYFFNILVVAMLLLIIFLLCIFVALGTGVLAGYSDIKGMTIPNSYSVIVIVSFVVCYLVLSVFGRDDVFFSLVSHVLGALIVFGVTAAMFAFGVLGAADSKLATAFALWVGVRGLFPFLFYMSLIGGVLALVSLALKKWKPFKAPAQGSWVAQVQGGASKVPYGVAIACGGLASFLNIGYFSVDVLTSFLLK